MTLSFRNLPSLATTRFAATCLAVGLVGLTLTGCRPLGSPTSDTAVTSANVDAEIRLRDVFRRYQVTSYYDDNGVVILHAPGARTDLSSETESAPLSVHFDPHELTVKAYTARIRVLARTDPANDDVEQVDLTAWFDEPESAHFDAQVLRHQWRSPVSDRLSLPPILSDEVLRARLSAGLAGPPPQLEWLLADHPMQKLFEPQTEFAWLRPASIDNAELQRIEVTSESERFVFWIDANTSLIHRVELPLPDLGARQAGVDRSGWSLRLELRSATFQPPSSGASHEFPLPPRDPKQVRAFVPLPPPPPSELIGRRISLRSSMQAVSESQQVRLSDNEYLLIAAPPTDRSELSPWLQTWMRAVPAFASPQFRNLQVVVVSSDHAVRDGLRGLPPAAITVVNPRHFHSLTRPLRMHAGAITLLKTERGDEDVGQVLLIETATNPNTLSNVLAVVGDAMAGVNVAKRIDKDYEGIIRDYTGRLREQRINDGF